MKAWISYAIHSLQVASGGIVNLFTRHMSIREASGLEERQRYRPEHYEVAVRNQKQASPYQTRL